MERSKTQVERGLRLRMSRIMIVEDEIAIQKMIAMNLKVAGYEVQCYDNGSVAENELRYDHEYELALLDIMIPGKDGFELLPTVRAYGIPVIFLTAKSDVASKVQGLKDGAEDYIVKPFEMLELLVRIEKVLERTSRMEQVIRVLDLEINFAEHSVRRDGVEIALKPMEFELLAVLAKNKNIAISREKLLAMVWGTDYVGETRTVDVHIGQLRKKLGLTEHIRTISKMGYRLED